MRFVRSTCLFFVVIFLGISSSQASVYYYQEEFYCDVTALYEVNDWDGNVYESGQIGYIGLKASQRYTHNTELEIDEYTKWWLDEYPSGPFISISDAVKNKEVEVIKKDNQSEELFLKITRNGIISILNALGAGLNSVKYISSFDTYELNLESYDRKINSDKSQKQNYFGKLHKITVHLYDSEKGFLSYYIRFDVRGPIPAGTRDGQREPNDYSRIN